MAPPNPTPHREGIMAGITLAQAEAKLAEYLAAETKVLKGQKVEIDGESLTRGLANLIAARGLSVREAERLAQQALNPKSKLPTPQPSRDILRLEEEIADRLGATVKIKANKKGAGAVTIQFGDLDQLEGLLEKLR